MQKEQTHPDRETNTLEQFPEGLFEQRDIVVLGEMAHGEHYKTILAFLDKFGPQIDRIFIELPVDYQGSVDKYVATGEVDEELEDFFIGAEKEGKNVRGLLEVFDKAKEIGKMVSCFDSSKTKVGEYQKTSKRGAYFLRGESRDDDMFVNLKRHYERAPGKYLLIVGGNHARDGRYPEGDERLGAMLKNLFGEKYISFEMQRENNRTYANE